MMRRAVVVAGLVFGVVGVARARAPGFWGVGDIPGGEHHSEVTGISGDGRVAVGSSRYANGEIREAFRWTWERGLEPIGDLPGGIVDSAALAASFDGSVIVGAGYGASGQEAFRWDTHAMRGLGTLTGHRLSLAYGVSRDGTTLVGFASSLGAFEAFRWTAESGMRGLGDFPGGESQSIATDVSGDGSIIVGYGRDEDGWQAFRWTDADGLRIVGTGAEGIHSYAHGVSTDGRVIVGGVFGAIPSSAFRWTAEGGMQALGHLPRGRESSLANATSADGSIVVGEAAVEGRYPYNVSAFIWDADHGMRDLRMLLEESLGHDLGGWHFTSAADISDDGTVIVGYGRNPLGQVEGWVAVIPEPVGVGIAGLTTLLLTRTRPRRHWAS